MLLIVNFKFILLKRFSTVMKACHHHIGHSLEAADPCWYSSPPSLLPFSAELLFPHIEASESSDYGDMTQMNTSIFIQLLPKFGLQPHWSKGGTYGSSVFCLKCTCLKGSSPAPATRSMQTSGSALWENRRTSSGLQKRRLQNQQPIWYGLRPIRATS